MSKLLEYCIVKKDEIQLPCLRILGNLAAGGSIKIVESLLEHQIIRILCDLISNSIATTTKDEILWIFTNISDSEVNVINKVSSCERFHNAMLSLLDGTPNNEVNFQLIYFRSNTAS